MKDNKFQSIPISPKILKAIALSYKNAYMVFSEYITNSIDQANKLFFNEQTNSYAKDIVIKVTHKGKNAKDSNFTFEDNCGGLEHKMESSTLDYLTVGWSRKAGDSKTVGKFGFGIMSFLGICERLTLSQKTEGWDHIDHIIFDSKNFETAGLQAVPIIFGDPTTYKGPISDKFTTVTLSDFKTEKFKEIDFEEFKSELETHFDLILRRKNITLMLIDNKGKEHICMPFDYDSIESSPFERTLTELKVMHYKRGKREKTISILPASVKMYYKVTKNKILNRRLYFASSGIRINTVTKLYDYRSNQKSDTYSHPNLIGYIDITGVVEPSITRDSFEPNELLKPLFYTLHKLEPEIKEYIESELRSAYSGNPKLLEVKLNEAINKFLKKKNRKLNNKKKNIEERAEEFENIEALLFNKVGKQSISSNRDDINSEKQSPENVKNIAEKMNRLEEVDIQIPKEETSQRNTDTDIKDNLFSLKIDDQNEPDTDENNNLYRSKFTGSEIIIFLKHPAFQSKLEASDGEQIITAGLITYLATEIMMHYYIHFSNLHNDEDDNSFLHGVLNEFISSVYEFENYLKDLKGKCITELN